MRKGLQEGILIQPPRDFRVSLEAFVFSVFSLPNYSKSRKPGGQENEVPKM